MVVTVVIILVVVVVKALLQMKIILIIYIAYFTCTSEGDAISISWKIKPSLSLGMASAGNNVEDRLILVHIWDMRNKRSLRRWNRIYMLWPEV